MRAQDNTNNARRVNRAAHLSPAVSLLKAHRLSLRCVAVASQCDQLTVRRALSLEKVGTVTHGKLHKIRYRVEALLRAAGWEGDSQKLWAAYDAPPERKAA